MWTTYSNMQTKLKPFLKNTIEIGISKSVDNILCL